MRELTTLDSLQKAHRLASYLALEAIESRIDEEAKGEWAIWILNDDDRGKANVILDEYESDPDDPKFERAERKVRSVLKEAERLQRERQKAPQKLKSRFGGSMWHSYPATAIVIALCILVAIVTTDWPRMERATWGLPALCNNNDSPALHWLNIQPPRIIKSDQTTRYIYTKPRLLLPELDYENAKTNLSNRWIGFSSTMERTWNTLSFWRPITPMFIHMDLLHLSFNMLWLFQLGGAIEYLRGTRRFLFICVATAVTSHLAQLWWSGPAFGGASGVVFGLIGYAWMKGRTRPDVGIGLESQTIIFAVFWLFMCMTGAIGNIANAAHLVGFLTGMLIGGRTAIFSKLPFVG